jgi:hypothetical protein
VKLYSRRVERSLRRAIRREVQASPALRAERKRARRQMRAPWIRAVRWLFLAGIVTNGLLAQFLRDEPAGAVEYGLMLHALAMTGIVLLLANSLMRQLFFSVDLMAMQPLPISSADFFQRQFERSCRWAVTIAAYCCIIFTGVLLRRAPSLNRIGIGIVLALIEACWCFSLVWLVVRYVRKNLRSLGIVLLLAALVLFACRELLWPSIKPYLPVLIWASPAGCGLGLFQYGLRDGQMLPWVMLLPMAVAAALAWPVVQQCARLYRMPEPFNFGAPGFEPARLNTLGAVDRAESNARETLGETPWQADSMPPIERAVWRWLTDREQVVARFLMGDALPTWSRLWVTAVVVSAVATAVGFLLSGDGRGLTLVIGTLVSAGIAVPLLGGVWLGLTPTHSGFGFVPLFAFYPIGFGEMIRTIMKANLIRWLAWLPVAIVNAWVVIYCGLGNPRDSTMLMVMALKGLIIVMAVQPLLFMFRLSRGTNDSELRWSRGLLPLGIVIGATVLTLGVSIGALAPSLALSLIFLPLVIACPILALLGYVWCLRWYRIDVCRKTL